VEDEGSESKVPCYESLSIFPRARFPSFLVLSFISEI
jgi:hypothetical protein